MKVILAVLLLISTNVMASGKLQFEPGYFIGAKSFGAKGGIAIHEPLFGNFFYSGWTGLGYSPQFDTNRMIWANSAHDVVRYFEKFSVGTGVAVSYGDENFGEGFKKFDYNVHLKFAYNVW